MGISVYCAREDLTFTPSSTEMIEMLFGIDPEMNKPGGADDNKPEIEVAMGS
jgi:hypothetical protein